MLKYGKDVARRDGSFGEEGWGRHLLESKWLAGPTYCM
jgi:hypothetical protein